MSAVEKAKLFALKAHGDQKYGESPYEKHLQDVADVIAEYIDIGDPSLAVLLNGAWLHDVIEDTDVTFQQVFEEFGRHVADVSKGISCFQTGVAPSR